MFNQFIEFVQKQNECNFDEKEQMIEETPLEDSCQEGHNRGTTYESWSYWSSIPASLELDLAPFACLASSPSFEHFLIKPMDDYVITDSNYDLGVIDIVMDIVIGMWASLVDHYVVEGIIHLLTLTTFT